MEVIGRGYTATVYAYDEKRVLKLFKQNYSKKAVIKEYNNSKLFEKFKIPMPKAYEMVEYDNRDGIIYDRLYGKSILEEIMISPDPTFFIHEFVKLHKEIIKNKTTDCECYKDFLIRCVAKDAIKQQSIRTKLEALPDGDNLCHGDYHPGNVFFTTNNETISIDFMNVCYGPTEYEVARTYYLLSEGDLPEDASLKNQIIILRKELAKSYLELMGYYFEELKVYFDIIKEVRDYEYGRV